MRQRSSAEIFTGLTGGLVVSVEGALLRLAAFLGAALFAAAFLGAVLFFREAAFLTGGVVVLTLLVEEFIATVSL